MLENAKNWVVTSFGFISSVIGIIFVFIKLENPSAEATVALILLGFFAVFFFCDSVHLRLKWARKARYATMINYLNKGFLEVHQLSRRKHISRKEIKSSLEKFCTSLADAFSYISGTQCSVCIKVIKKVELDDGTKIAASETFCRDINADDRRKRVDSLSLQNNIIHPLQNNTAFKLALHSLHTADQRGFASNKLPFLYHYENSSIDSRLYGVTSESTNSFMRNWRWPLPYKSTIVMPIFPLHHEMPLDENKAHSGGLKKTTPSGFKVTKVLNSDNILGFLCLDSDSYKAFISKFDRAIMAGVADGIYNTLNQYKSEMQKPAT